MISSLHPVLLFLIALGAFILLFRIHQFFMNRWTVHTVFENDATLLFRHGKLLRQLSPGRHRFFGLGYDLVQKDQRWQESVVAGQELLTKDHANVRFTVLAIYRIVDPVKHYRGAANPESVLYSAIQLAMRDLVGDLVLQDVIERKDNLGNGILARVKETAEELGFDLREVAIRDVLLSGELKRALTGVLQAKAEGLAELEKARGTSAAVRTLANASRAFGENPHLLELRYLQILEESASQPGSTVVLGDLPDWLQARVRGLQA